MCRGAPVPIPTVAEARELRGAHERDLDMPAPRADTQASVADDVPLRLDALMPKCEARVRKDNCTREPCPRKRPLAQDMHINGHGAPKGKASGQENGPRIPGHQGHRVGMRGANKGSWARPMEK